jgi:hypothetical protein
MNEVRLGTFDPVMKILDKNPGNADPLRLDDPCGSSRDVLD